MTNTPFSVDKCKDYPHMLEHLKDYVQIVTPEETFLLDRINELNTTANYHNKLNEEEFLATKIYYILDFYRKVGLQPVDKLPGGYDGSTFDVYQLNTPKGEVVCFHSGWGVYTWYMQKKDIEAILNLQPSYLKLGSYFL
jgi:hypothetical protein